MAGSAMKTSPLTDDQQQYLRSMLALEPNQWASVGLRERNAFLHPSALPSLTPIPLAVDEAQDAESRSAESQAVIELINACLKEFWSPEAPALMERLRLTTYEKAPELQAIAQRLLSWYPVRDLIRALVTKMGYNSLASELRNMATMSARELANAKSEATKRQREWLGGGYRRQAKRIKAQHPDIYALDPEWFDELIAFRR